MDNVNPVSIPIGLIDGVGKVNLSDIGMYIFLSRHFWDSDKITVKSVCCKTGLNYRTVSNSLERIRQAGYLRKGGRYDGYEFPGDNGESQKIQFELQKLTNELQNAQNEPHNLQNELYKAQNELQNMQFAQKSREEKERSKEREENTFDPGALNNSFLQVKENDKEKEILKKEKAEEGSNVESDKPKTKPFIPPTEEEVREYCRERKSTVSASMFVSFYASKGWMVGKNRMKDWKAAVRQWEYRNKVDGKTYVPPENLPPADDDYPF